MDAAWHPASALFRAAIEVLCWSWSLSYNIATRYISQWLMLYEMKLCGLRISQQRQLSGWRVGMSKSGWLSAIPLGLRGVSALFIALISSFCRRSYPALSLPTSSQVTIALNPTKWGKKRQKGGRGSWNSGFGISRTFCTKEDCVALWTHMTKENMRKDHLPWGNRWEIYLKIEGWGIHTSRWKLVSP